MYCICQPMGLHLYRKSRENMLKQLTSTIIDEMDRQGMTVSKLAKELNKSKQYVSKLLNGGMNIYYLGRICEILNLHIMLLPKRYM